MQPSARPWYAAAEPAVPVARFLTTPDQAAERIPMDDPRNWMWAEACALIERAERLHRQFFQPSAAAAASWEPPVDIFESEREVQVIAALPGVESQDVSLGFTGDELIITGLRRLPPAARGSAIHRLELPFGRFERRIRIAGGLELDGSELARGCLSVRLRKQR
jgi:HSP20 family molecular chaperone IbpA